VNCGYGLAENDGIRVRYALGTHDDGEGKAGLSYMVSKNVSLLGQWHSEYGWGGGLQVRF